MESNKAPKITDLVVIVPDDPMSHVDVVNLLRIAQGHQTLTAFAATVPCSVSYLSDVMNGKRDVGPTLLDALQIDKQVTYKKRWR